MPRLIYPNKILTFTWQIEISKKENIHALMHRLGNSIEHTIHILNHLKTYKEALTLVLNKKLELNGGMPKQGALGHTHLTPLKRGIRPKRTGPKQTKVRMESRPQIRARVGSGFKAQGQAKVLCLPCQRASKTRLYKVQDYASEHYYIHSLYISNCSSYNNNHHIHSYI